MYPSLLGNLSLLSVISNDSRSEIYLTLRSDTVM